MNVNKKDELKELQISFLRIILIGLSKFNQGQFYQIFNLLRDIDFSIKLVLNSFFLLFNTKKNNFTNELVFTLSIDDIRFRYFSLYNNPLNDLSIFNEKEKKIIYNTLTIKDFIIIGEKGFHEKIKTIEKYIKSESFQYLNIQQIHTYLEQKKKENSAKIVPYFYFLIIRIEDFNKNLENIFMLSFKSGILFLVFLYMENEDIRKFTKNQMIYLLPHILVYSPEDIVSYISEKKNFLNFVDFPNAEEIFDIKIPKITFKQNLDDIYQDGCFELAETFPIDLIKNKILVSLKEIIDYTFDFSKAIYYIYKEHNALDIFYSQNCLYFGWYLYPELLSWDIFSDICFVKRFLYMYCREEAQSNKSFYRIMNDDFRSRDPHKISRYITILALINQIIEKNFVASFEGKVYRATKLDENLIMKLVPGKKMVNTTFWSTSKDFKIAENFMINQNFRNSFIICKSMKNNIDIDIEKLNPYNEKEVLFLPFTEFIVEKVSYEKKYGRKVFIIELSQLGNNNFVNPKNMKIENINLSFENIFTNYLKWKGVNTEELYL